jgi:hypothetical protein
MQKQHTGMNQADGPWADELDPLNAAPDNRILLFENEFVRVLDTVIRPGETTPLHTHCWPCTLYVQSWSDFVRRDVDGNVMADSRKIESLSTPPKVLWLEPLPPIPWKMWVPLIFAASALS